MCDGWHEMVCCSSCNTSVEQWHSLGHRLHSSTDMTNAQACPECRLHSNIHLYIRSLAWYGSSFVSHQCLGMVELFTSSTFDLYASILFSAKYIFVKGLNRMPDWVSNITIAIIIIPMLAFRSIEQKLFWIWHVICESGRFRKAVICGCHAGNLSFKMSAKLMPEGDRS